MISGTPIDKERTELFRHVTADKAVFYRTVMETFATAHRQFTLQLRPDEVLKEAQWPQDEVPPIESVQHALSSLAEWGNLVAQPDTSRVSSLEDFYRARFLYRLSAGGEAVEVGLAAFAQALARRAELQSVALEDILVRLEGLSRLAAETPLDAAKVHGALRDLVGVFGGLAENAQAFMAGIARSMDLRRAELAAVLSYKTRLIEYIERFIGDLVARSGRIAEHLLQLAPQVDGLLEAAAEREARDAAPGDPLEEIEAYGQRLESWRERWRGLRRWFVAEGSELSQAELLRARARSAIPQLLTAIAALNERRRGVSDRSADFRVLARWFADCHDDAEAHRLWRAAFALNPARHLALVSAVEAEPANTPWASAAPVAIQPRLRERGSLAPRGPAPKILDRTRERELLALRQAGEVERTETAWARFATGLPQQLSALKRLSAPELQVLLSLLGEALAAQRTPDEIVEHATADGAHTLRLEPLAATTRARIATQEGSFGGRDHMLTVTAVT